MPSTIVFVVLAFVPAGGLFALGTYLKAHPPDSSEEGVRRLVRGLRAGAASAVALPLVYILFYFHPVPLLGNLPYLVITLAGNILNAFGLLECLRELSGASLLAAFILALVQLLWIWTAFSALMAAN
jgi:hypothetical protein